MVGEGGERGKGGHRNPLRPPDRRPGLALGGGRAVLPPRAPTTPKQEKKSSALPALLPSSLKNHKNAKNPKTLYPETETLNPKP